MVMQAYKFALDPTPAQARRMASHAGASRFAYNRMLAEVKSTLDARQWEKRLLGGCLTPSQGWSLAALRRTWNANKNVWAPWWPEVSKEAFNHGLEALSAALKNWVKGKESGRNVGFPRFKKRAGRASFAYTTGSIHLLDDRRSVQLPRLGRLHTHENTRKLHRRLDNSTARILRATVSRDAAGRWHVSYTVEVQRAVAGGVRRHQTVGVDVGVRDLLVAATADGQEVLRVPAPRSLGAAQKRLAQLQRRAARQQRGSNRRAKTLRAIGRTHARVGNVRRDALHKATTHLAKSADAIVVEDLNVDGMRRRKVGLGARGRGFNRAVADASMAEVRRMLGYKASWYGADLVVADRWYPSSKTCSGCRRRKPSLPLSERTYHCNIEDSGCGLTMDRDLNAAVNLAHLGVPSAGSGPGDVNDGRGADRETDPAQAGDVGGDEASTLHQPRLGQTGTATPQEVAA